MDTGITHFHVLIVALYALLMLILLLPLLAKLKNLFVTLRGKVRFVRLSLEILLLLTGAYLIYRSPARWENVFILKYVVFFVAIVAFIIGLRKLKPIFIIVGLLLWAYAFGLSRTRHVLLLSEAQQTAQMTNGKKLYQHLCVRCHGEKGNAMFQKATNLQAKKFSKTQIENVLSKGKNLMPAFDYLSAEQKDSIAVYVQTLSNQ